MKVPLFSPDDCDGAVDESFEEGWQENLFGEPPTPAQETPPYAPPCDRQKPSL